MSEVLHADNLQVFPNLRHGFYTRTWGDCGFSTAKDVSSNRIRVAEHLHISSEHLLSCYQTHSPNVVTVKDIWPMSRRPEADGMVTRLPGVALGILTADCAPVLLVDPEAGVVGACHAGWRGAISGVIENTIEAMERLGARRTSIHAAIGACIWQNSYEVGPEFPAPFLAERAENESFFRPSHRRDKYYMFNLPGYVEAKLKNLGLPSVAASPADTQADEKRFFSYRRSTLRGEQRAGSLISLIVMKG